MHLFWVAWSLNLSFFEKIWKPSYSGIIKNRLYQCIKSLPEGGVKKRFCPCRNLRREFILSITFKSIESPERLSSKMHPKYFTSACCLMSVPLYTIFKHLAFQILCLVPNNSGFFCLVQSVNLVYCQQTSYTRSKNLWLVAFQFELRF